MEYARDNCKMRVARLKLEGVTTIDADDKKKRLRLLLDSVATKYQPTASKERGCVLQARNMTLCPALKAQYLLLHNFLYFSKCLYMKHIKPGVHFTGSL